MATYFWDMVKFDIKNVSGQVDSLGDCQDQETVYRSTVGLDRVFWPDLSGGVSCEFGSLLKIHLAKLLPW